MQRTILFVSVAVICLGGGAACGVAIGCETPMLAVRV
jgi:hypothetical protein